MPAAVCPPLVGRMSSLPWYYPQWRVAVVEEYVTTAVGEGYCDLDQQRTVAEEGAEAAVVAEVPSLEVPPLPSLGNDEKVAAADRILVQSMAVLVVLLAEEGCH